MYSQACVRVAHCLVRAWPPVVGGTEKVLAGSGWARDRGLRQFRQDPGGWKGGRPLVRSRAKEPESPRPQAATHTNSMSVIWTYPGQPSYLIKNGISRNVRPTNHISLVQDTDHQIRALGDRKHTRAVGDQPLTEGSIIGSSNLTDVFPADVKIAPPARIVQRNLLRIDQEGSTIYPLIFRKTRFAKYADARKLRERHAK